MNTRPGEVRDDRVARQGRTPSCRATRRIDGAASADGRSVPDWWGELPEKDRARLDTLQDRFDRARHGSVGYPINLGFDYSELFRFLGHAGNNVGDPFTSSVSRLHTHDFEREVVGTFTSLLHGEADATWGYVTSGGTEGNMYGLYLARELHPRGIVFFSEDTHYSVPKILRVLDTRSIMIKSRPTGEMDIDDLRETLRIHRDVPPIVVANIGTTMKGAVDDVAAIRRVFDDLAIARHYIHCDAALSGMILPFVQEPQPFDFGHRIDSIAVSGHKLIGSPVPCGVVLARRTHVDRIARSVEYVGTLDTTISGSRSAISPLMLWYALRRIGRSGFERLVSRSIALADYAIGRFAEHGIAAWRNPNSITVVFPRPGSAAFEKWQIAPYRDIAHIITLPHVDETVLDELVSDCAAAGAAGPGGAS